MHILVSRVFFIKGEFWSFSMISGHFCQIWSFVGMQNGFLCFKWSQLITIYIFLKIGAWDTTLELLYGLRNYANSAIETESSH